MRNAVFFLMGPTAIGKTQLAIDLSETFPIDIISVDSAMVYRNLNIGTGKPSVAQLCKTPHDLIDIRNPTEYYSAAQFVQDAGVCVERSFSQQKIPLLVGGTMLYFRAFEQGLSSLPQRDPVIRERLLQEAERLGWDKMHDKLAAVDPKSASKIHRHDPQRIQRALEVFEITQKPMSLLWEESSDRVPEQNIIKIALVPKHRKDLHDKIALRFDQMLSQGLVEEVQTLLQTVNSSMPAMRMVGYRQVCQYLEGELNYSEMREKAIAATRQLAKRQLTWLRSLKNAHILEIDFIHCPLQQIMYWIEKQQNQK